MNIKYILTACTIIYFLACSGRGNIDLSKAKTLGADPIAGSGPNGTAIPDDNTQYAPLFSYQPGQVVSRKVGAVIDMTGTAMNDDFDGDGLLNTTETASSPWVADYPRVEASIAPPTTMIIDIEKSTSGSGDTISSDITSDDFENNQNQGTENLHRNEIGVRTTQVQNKYSGSSESSGSVSDSSSVSAEGSVGMEGIGLSGGGKSSSSSSSSWSQASSFSSTVTTFPDAPATNNLDRDAWSVKADSAAKNARQYRSDKGQKVNTSSIIRPDAGRVRAALYIKNYSVNMPVHLTNILCTLMFETPTGQLIPMQSFRLRNDDFSVFSLDLYGSSEFGPYVIDLKNLNTVEVENAIKLGYNPKIYIVDFDMSHVPNSNYQRALPGQIGNNVKIVEENAKGRTALFKIKGPGVREMFRVAAFEFENATDSCAIGSGNYVAGISLEDALKRLNCARSNNQLDGVGIDFAPRDYVFDLSDVLPNLPAEKVVMIHSIGQLAGISNNVPCKSTSTSTGSDGVVRTNICYVRKVSEMTPVELENFGMWIVFANGKYYTHSDYIRDLNGKAYIDSTVTNPAQQIHMLKGIQSFVWAGDNYDLVYVSLQELISTQGRFGSNPLETSVSLPISTRWDNSTVGSLDTKYQPDKFSVFLGKISKDDQVQLTFKLNGTKKLNYDFGDGVGTGSKTYSSVTYSLDTLTQRFVLADALQFEINMGLGGNKSNWIDITDTAILKPCNGGTTLDASIDFVAQVFTVCFKVPASPYDFSGSGTPTLMNLYLRPKLLDEYRNVIWLEKQSEIRKFKALLNVDAAAGSRKVQISHLVGAVDVGDTFTIGSNLTTYRVDSIAVDVANTKLVNVDLSTVSGGNGLGYSQRQFDSVKADSPLVPTQLVSLVVTNGYYSGWNTFLTGLSGFANCGVACTFNTAFSGSVTGAFGLSYTQATLNWIGRNLFRNDLYDYARLDGSQYEALLSQDLSNFLLVPNGTDKLSFNLGSSTPATLQYGLNNFFTAPLIERNYTVTAKLR